MVDTQKSMLTHLWDLLTEDTGLKGIMSDPVRCYLTWAKPDAEFPYLVHRIEIMRESGTHVIQRASYYLDAWSDSPDANEILAIRERLIQLLDELVFSTTEIGKAHIEIVSARDLPESEQDIWHQATLWEIVFRRDAEAVSIEGR